GGCQQPAQSEQGGSRGVGKPAKVPRLLDGEPRELEGPRVLLERREIDLLRRAPTEQILDPASKGREASIHVDHYRIPAGTQQREDVSRTIGLLPQPVAIAERVDADDEVEGLPNLLPGATETLSDVLSQGVVASDDEAHPPLELWRRVPRGLLARRLDHSWRKIRPDGSLDLDIPLPEQLDQLEEVHPASAAVLEHAKSMVSRPLSDDGIDDIAVHRSVD